MIKCIEKHNDKFVYKFYKSCNDSMLDLLYSLLSKHHDKGQVNEILDLFGDYNGNIYKCYTSKNNQFNELIFNSLHIRIFSYITNIFPLIKKLYSIINPNSSDYYKFINLLDKELFINLSVYLIKMVRYHLVFMVTKNLHLKYSKTS